MPYYNLENTETGKAFTEFMSISELDEYLLNNSNIKQLLSDAPFIAYRPIASGTKPDAAFRERLNHIKSKHLRPNINTC